jgi:hypothetical protein
VQKLAPRAPRRRLIRLGLMQRSKLCYPLLPQIMHERWLTAGQPSNLAWIPPPRWRSGLRLGGDGKVGNRWPAALLTWGSRMRSDDWTTGGGAVSALARAALPSAITSHGLVFSKSSNDGLVGDTLKFLILCAAHCEIMSLPPTHPNTKKDYYALLKPDPPVSFLPLLLHLSSSLFQ